MLIAGRLRALRVAKHLSQGDIEKRTSLYRMYISRVENGHTVPSIETLEKLARGLEVPLYQLSYEGNEPPKPLLKRTGEKLTFGRRKEEREFERFRKLLSRMTPQNRTLLLAIASRMATRTKRPRLTPLRLRKHLSAGPANIGEKIFVPPKDFPWATRAQLSGLSGQQRPRILRFRRRLLTNSSVASEVG